MCPSAPDPASPTVKLTVVKENVAEFPSVVPVTEKETAFGSATTI